MSFNVRRPLHGRVSDDDNPAVSHWETSIKLYVGRWFDHKSGKDKDHEIAI